MLPPKIQTEMKYDPSDPNRAEYAGRLQYTLDQVHDMVALVIADAERYKRERDEALAREQAMTVKWSGQLVLATEAIVLLRELLEPLGLTYGENGAEDKGVLKMVWADGESRARFLRAQEAGHAFLARIEQGDASDGERFVRWWSREESRLARQSPGVPVAFTKEQALAAWIEAGKPSVEQGDGEVRP